MATLLRTVRRLFRPRLLGLPSVPLLFVPPMGVDSPRDVPHGA